MGLLENIEVTPAEPNARVVINSRTGTIVIGGMLQPAGMVSFSRFLTPEDAEAIRQYVLSEANRLYPQSAEATP